MGFRAVDEPFENVPNFKDGFEKRIVLGGCVKELPDVPKDPWIIPTSEITSQNIGWQCPVCGRGLPPHADYCDHGDGGSAG